MSLIDSLSENYKHKCSSMRYLVEGQAFYYVLVIFNLSLEFQRFTRYKTQPNKNKTRGIIKLINESFRKHVNECTTRGCTKIREYTKNKINFQNYGRSADALYLKYAEGTIFKFLVLTWNRRERSTMLIFRLRTAPL